MTSFESTIENANRALYGTVRRRTFFFKGLTVLLAAQMFFFGMAPMAWALPGGLAGDSRVTTSGSTMTIHPNAGANAGSNFSWDSFNVANGETVTIDATSIHNAPSFDVAGLVDAGGNVLVFKTPGGNIAVSGTIRAGRFFAATFGSFNYENMSFNASDVASGTIDITGSIPSGSILVGKTISNAGAAGTVVGTAGMDGASEITIASGGGTITFKGVMGDASVLKAGTVTFGDNATANGTVDAGPSGTISGNFTQSGGTVNANQITGTLTQNGGEATANRIQALTQTAGTANTTEITGIANQSAGTINAGSATATLKVGAGSTLGAGDVTAGTITVNNGAGALTLAGNQLNEKTINAGAVTLGGEAGQNYNVGGRISSIRSGDNAAGAVTVNNSGALTLGTINASSLSATTTGAGANITQSGATTISDNGNVTLNVGANTITLSQGVSGAGTLTLTSNNGTPANAIRVSGGTVSAETITLGGSAKTLSQSGGNITVSGANFLTGSDTLAQSGGSASFASSAAAVSQSGSGTINATTLSGTVTQSAGTIKAKDDTGLTLNQAITTQNGTLSGNGGDITLAGGDTLSGTVSAKNLSAGTGNITQSAGTITVEETLTAGKFTQGGVAATTASAATIAANVEQTGAGTIKTDSINGTVSQTGAAKLQANGSTLALNGNVVQNNANATIGTTSTGVTVNQGFTQNAGKIEATTLTLNKAGQAYTLGSANNKISTLSGSAASVSVNNGTDISLSGLTTSGADGVTVTSARNVTLAGVTAAKVVVESASGQVKDTTAQTADMTVTLGDAANNKTVGSVLLTQGSGAVNIDGINAAGDVGIKNAAIVQNGAISGANVTLDQTGEAGTLVVANNITATSGDILVRSAKDVSVGGSDYSPTLSASGNIVVKGKSVAIGDSGADNRTLLSANAIGVEATAGNVEINKSNFVAPDVALKASGNLAFDNNVAMGKTTAGQKDASLVVYAGGTIDDVVLGANRPVENLTIAKGTIGLSSDSAAPTVIELNRFVYNTDDSTADVYVTFKGAEIGLESKGNVNVAATREEGVTIVAGSSIFEGSDASGIKVEAKDATVPSGTDSVEIRDSAGSDDLAVAHGLIASGDGKTVKLTGADSTQPPAGSVTVAKGAKISSNADLDLKTAAGKNFTIEAGDANTGAGIVESTAGKVSITSGGALNVDGTVQTHSASPISLKTNGTGENAKDIAISGTVDAGLNGSGGSVILDSATDKIVQSGSSSFIEGMKVIATGETIEQSGGILRTHGADDQGGIVASKVIQSGPGTIVTTKIDGGFEQTEAAGAARLLKHSSASTELVVTGSAVQKSGDAIIGGSESTRLEFDGPDSAVTLGSLDQDAGTINATTLTLRNDSTSAGTITAESIVAQTADGTPVLKKLTQDGAGTITVTGADGIKADKVVQSSTGTIKADKIDAALTQSGAATARANADDGSITVVGKLTQSAEGATLGYAGQNDSGDDVVQKVTLQGGAMQESDRFGKVLADTLTLNGNDNEYSLNSLEGNAVSTLAGSAKSVGINNGTTDLTLQVNVGTAEDHTVSVLKAGDVTLDGVTAKSIFVAKAGDVTDTENQGATTIQLGVNDPELGSTVGKVTLTKGTGALAIEGINATGDVGIQNASITQNGAISGKNVTLDQTAATGTLTVGKDITATGDILVRSADKVKVGKVGDAGTVPTLSAANGNIIVKGAGDATVQNVSMEAKQIGIESTDGAVKLKNLPIVASDGVVALKSGGDMTVDEGVAAGKTASDGKDADVTIKAEGALNMTAANQPTAPEKLNVSAGSLGEVHLTDGTGTVDYNSFLYTHSDRANPNLDFTFTGSKISILNEQGSVKVKTGGQNLSIVDSSATGNDTVEVVARDLFSPASEEADQVEKVVVEASDAAGSEGIVAKGDITVNGSGVTVDDPGAITVKGTVSSAEGAVSIQNAGAIEVAAGGTVQAGGGAVGLESADALTVAGTVRDFIPVEDADPTTASGGVTLETTGTGDAAKDVTVSGTAESKGATTMTSAKDAVLSGTVSSDGKLSITAANDVKLSGTVSTKDNLVLTAGSGNINQTAGSVTANGEGKTTELTANAGSISLAATAAGAPANDFAKITTAVAKNTISISDRNSLEIAGATATDGAIAITAANDLTVSDAVSAGKGAALTAGNGGTLTAQNVTAGTAGTEGDATLTGASVDAKGTVTASSGLVSLTATDGEVKTAAEVSGQNVALDATEGVTEGAVVNAANDKFVHTSGGNITIDTDFSAKNAVYKADDGEIIISDKISGVTDGLGLEGNGLTVDGTKISNVKTLVVNSKTGDVTLTGKPDGVETLAVAAGGDLKVQNADGSAVEGDFTFANGSVAASVPAGKPAADRTVAVNGLAAGGDLVVDVTGSFTSSAATAGGDATITAGTTVNAGNVAAGGEAAVTAGGNITAASIAGAGGTTVTAENGGAINVAGNLGQGGQTTVNANGAAVNVGTLTSGGLLDVNNAGAVNANVNAGGNATIQAATLTAGQTTTGGNLTFDNVGGAANVGNLNVGGDMNGNVGSLTTAGGNVGSVGQQGGFNSPGGVNINGDLASQGAVTVNQGGAVVLDGALNAGNANVNIAGASIAGNGLLTSGNLTLQMGGNVGTSRANPLQLDSGTIANVTGQNIYLQETSTGALVPIGTIAANGELYLRADNMQGGGFTDGGGAGLSANGDLELDVGGTFGTISDPISVTLPNYPSTQLIIGHGTLSDNDVLWIHIVVNGEQFYLPVVDSPIGFVIINNQLAGGSLKQIRAINRALAFTVNTPELKSSQGIFGSPSFIHTRMNVSEARSMGNMDMLALNNTDFRATWEFVRLNADVFEEDWNPPVDMSEESPLDNKIKAVKSEAEQQPEVLPFSRRLRGE